MFINSKNSSLRVIRQEKTVTRQFRVIQQDQGNRPLPRLCKSKRCIFERIKELARICCYGNFIHGNYDTLAPLINLRLKKKITPEYLRSVVHELQSYGLLKIERKVYYDRGEHTFSHGYLKIIPDQFAKYRHSKRFSGFHVFKDDLTRWGLERAGSTVGKSCVDFMDHIEPHVGRGEQFNDTDSKLLDFIFKKMHTKNALKSIDSGIRWVTFSYASYAEELWRSSDTIGISIRKLEKLGYIVREKLRDKTGIDCFKITIDFKALALGCRDPEIELQDPRLRELTKLRTVCGKLCVENKVTTACLREDVVSKIYEHRDKILYTSFKDKSATLDGVCCDNQVSCCQVPVEVQANDNKKNHLSSLTSTSQSPAQVLTHTEEEKKDFINQKIEVIEAPKELKRWFLVDNSFTPNPPMRRYRDFDKERFIDFVVENIYGDDSTNDGVVTEGCVAPDSRVERQWLAINFGIHALKFLSKSNFKCFHVLNNVFEVRFESNDLKLVNNARASLSKLHYNAQLISVEKFRDAFRRRINGQLLQKWAPRNVIEKVRAWLARSPLEVQIDRDIAHALREHSKRERIKRRLINEELERHRAHH